jgi:MSHA biogenesis protein MshL
VERGSFCLRVAAVGPWLFGAVALPATLAAQPPAKPAVLPSGQPPPLPLTQLDDRVLAADLDNRAFTLTFAQPVAIGDLLLLLVRGTSLSLVPDPGISGSFIGELKNVTVRQALGLVLPPLDLNFAAEGGVIRVFRREPETRLFDVNYIATLRTASSRVGADAAGRADSFAQVESATGSDLFAELGKGVQTLLSSRGVFNLDRKAGLLQATDFPERLDRVAVYLDAVQTRANRQVQIEALVVEVELTDAAAQGLDWTALRQSAGAAATGTRPTRALSGLRVTDVAKFLAALAEQGKVETLASPRLRALNNEPAIVRCAEARTNAADSQSGLGAVTLSVTPQIGADGVVMLSLSPFVTLGSGHAAAAAPAIREADTLARVADGETIVMAGFGRDRELRERKSVGRVGGWLGRATVVTKRRVELVVLLTPTILNSSE